MSKALDSASASTESQRLDFASRRVTALRVNHRGALACSGPAVAGSITARNAKKAGPWDRPSVHRGDCPNLEPTVASLAAEFLTMMTAISVNGLGDLFQRIQQVLAGDD